MAIKDFYIPIVSTLLGASAALFGVHYASEGNKELWRLQENMSQTRALLDKRIDLIERVSKLANSSPKMTHYQSYLSMQALVAAEYVECSKQKLPACEAPDSTRDALEVSAKRADLNAEFSSTLQLVSLYLSLIHI